MAARRAHNPKVAGSSPVPATTKQNQNQNNMSDNIKLRSKGDIISSLPKAVKKSDAEHVRKVYPGHGNIVKNGYPNAHNPASWIGWGRTEDGQVVRIEGETRVGRSGNKSLSLKIITIPNDLAVELDLDDPKVPDYISQETKDFLDQ